MGSRRGLIQPTSYMEQAREVIKHLIFDGTYEPGERLKEVELAQTLGVSRGPIREAIQSLANEGLIRLTPQRGAFVSTFDPEKIRELYEVREALEALAVRLATERASPPQLDKLYELLEATKDSLESSSSTLYPRDLDFHQRICELALNRELVDHVSEIHAQLQLARSKSSSQPGRARLAYEEHLAIYEALKEKGSDKAEAAMRQHLQNGLNSTLEVLGQDIGAA